MAKVKRIHQIAKELGVSSKEIVAKCEAEGVPDIKNHMAPVKLGLEMTIRDWFGSDDAGGHTAVDTAESDDAAPRAGARKRAKPVDEPAKAQPAAAGKAAPGKAAASAEGDSPRAAARKAASQNESARRPAARRKAALRKDTPEATVGDDQDKAQAKSAKDDTAAATKAGAGEAPVGGARPAARRPATEVKPAETPATPDAAESPARRTAVKIEKPPEDPGAAAAKAAPVKGRPNVPDRPDVVKPAGQQLLKPKTAALKGPKVVRIEKPDELAKPRPKRGGPGGGPGDGGVPGISRSRGPARGRGAGGPAEPDSGGKGGGPGGKHKRRSLSTRRGRSAEAETLGRTRFTEADMAELDARLNRSGFMRQRRRDMKQRQGQGVAATAPVVTGGKVEISEPITIKSLSSVTGIKGADVVKYLFKKGIMANINSAIDAEAAMEVAMEYNIELIVKEQETAEEAVLKEFEDRDAQDKRARPPVVAVLGHVDHGKTSLLDRIRSADVAAHEAGGITQHIGAHRVTVHGGDGQEKTVVFLDTPGHQAFTSMRARGAGITDMVVLVVAADDGVMPQTLESIHHAQAAKVPIIVALNKIDKAEATQENIQKIYGQLAEHGLNPTDWGGDTEVMRVSAIEGTGVTELIEMLDYQAELLELNADYAGAARGTVIEAEMQQGRGPVARVLVEEGQVRVGDFIVVGRAFGRVRDMTDDKGRSLAQAGPATPVEISGIDEVPDAGNKFYITSTLAKAEDVAHHYRETERNQLLAQKTKVTLDNFSQQVQAGEVKELRIVLKADVQGSIDVLKSSLTELNNNEVAVKVLHTGVGGISETDVLLADASEAIVVGFHVIAPAPVREIAEQRHVDLRLYRVIYDIVDDIKAALEGMLTPDRREEEIGTADVKDTFKVSKVGTVAGCLVTQGMLTRDARMRVIRDSVVITDDRKVDSLRRIKDDAKEVRAGTECGVKLQGFDDVKPGDQIVCYKVIEVKRTLEDTEGGKAARPD